MLVIKPVAILVALNLFEGLKACWKYAALLPCNRDESAAQPVLANLLLLKACNCVWTSNVVLLSVFNSTAVAVTSTPSKLIASAYNLPSK